MKRNPSLSKEGVALVSPHSMFYSKTMVAKFDATVWVVKRDALGNRSAYEVPLMYAAEVIAAANEWAAKHRNANESYTFAPERVAKSIAS